MSVDMDFHTRPYAPKRNRKQKTEHQMTLTLIIHKMLINVKFFLEFHGNSVFLITTSRFIGTQLTGKLNASL